MVQWTVKGKRPSFFEDPAIDHMMSMVLALGSELWSLRERVHILETVAESKGVMLSEDIERYELSPEESARLGKNAPGVH